MFTLREIATALGGDVSGHSAVVPGPGHSPKDRSLSIALADNDVGFVCHSFAGDDPIHCKDYVREKLGLPAFKPNGKGKSNGNGASRASEDDVAKALMAAIGNTPPPQQIYRQSWIYKNDDGTPYLRVERNGGKSYPQSHWNGSGWDKGKPAGPKIPYRLPELVNAPAQPVFICEGEKCADAVAELGWLATSASEGAEKWKSELNKWFSDRVVYILPDNDEPGRKHADMVASNLHGVAREVHIVKLEGLGDGEDVFDWIKREPFPENLLRIAEDSPLWNPAEANPSIVPPSSKNAKDSAAVSLDDFYAYMPMHQYIFTPTRDLWPASSVNARIPPVGNIPAVTWLDRNKPVEQMTWMPGEAMIIKDRFLDAGGLIAHSGITCFNLYRPPTIKHGDPNQAGAWVDHVRRVYPDDANHLIKWQAHRVQRPHEKINHALVLGGKQGIGKDTMLEPVKRAIGPWNFDEVSPQQMQGRFTSFLKSVILRVSEARDLGEFDRYKFYDHSKAYIAAPPDVLRLDEKHIREYSIPNVVGVVITTNHKTDGIYLPADDRRHYVAWSELTKDDFDPEYWTRLWCWYEAGGDGHVAAYLAGLDLTGFDPKAPPPKTQAFWEIVDASRAPEDSEMQDAIDALGNPDALTLPQVIALADADFALFLRDRKNARRIPHRLEACGYVAVRNSGTTDGRWKVAGHNQTIYSKASLPLRNRIAAASALAAQ